MSKAVAGAALLTGAAIALGVLTGGLSFAGIMALTSTEMDILGAVAMAGVSMEAAAIAGALTSNRGMAITTRQAAACRQIVYGQRRVGGVAIYESTTGSSVDQYNYVIVLAGHVCDSIQNLYLDGRQVHWHGSGVGWSVRNGVGFGGIADGNTYTGPDGLQYNFGGTGHSGIYAEARYGDQLAGDVIGGLTANDPNWAADGHGNSPWVGGCTYIYLKVEFNSTVFPNAPEVRITVNGKNDIYDPRTGTTGFTSNWALICADVLTDSQFGLGDDSVNQDQLIAAANVCDEMVLLGVTDVGGGPLFERRYCSNWNFDTSTGPGNALAEMMPGAQGRLSRIGGEWHLWPAYWQGPSFTFDANALTGPPQWTPYRSTRDLCNRVDGTYIAATYPYNVSGNLYDLNGFYNGQIQNNFNSAFQVTSFPEYAADTLHGYSSDQYLTADGGRLLPKELTLNTVLSVTQAQRCAKILMMRNRQQGSGSLQMSLPAYKAQPVDVMQFTFPEFGWAGKYLEITGTGFTCEVAESSNGDKAPSIGLGVKVVETDPSVYDWSTIEELTPYDVPTTPTQNSLVPAPPTNMSLTSSLATALIGLDGVVNPRVEIQWDAPLDTLTNEIQIQHQTVSLAGVGAWISGGSVDASLTGVFVGGMVSGQEYDFRIRSVRPSGVTSVWVEWDGFTVGTVLTILTQEALAETSLTAIAYTGGTASIYGVPFTAPIGNLNLAIAPSNYPLTGLSQNQLYFVYYIDLTFAGGAVTAIATQTQADFLNKPGYFLIGTIVTPVTGGGTSTTGPWFPSSYADRQNGAAYNTNNPAAPYNLDFTQFASMFGSYIPSVPETLGTDIIYSGFVGITGSAATLVVARQNYSPILGTGGTYTISISFDSGSTWATVETVAAPGTIVVPETTYAIPSGTDLSLVQVQIVVGPDTSGSMNNSVGIGVSLIVIEADVYHGVHPLHIG